MKKSNQGLPVSIQARLLNHARKQGVDYNRVLERYALERFLYRLSQSPHGERFVLKGAMMMVVWLGEDIRPTRDADLLGFGELSDATLLNIFHAVCKLTVDPDGMAFDTDTLTIEGIREDDPYGGRRIALLGHLGNARLPIQVDIGIGDIIIPEPKWLDYPSLLGMPSARLRVYHAETSIAEKFHAMNILGMANSRMKDFFDIAMLAERETFDGTILATAIRATFERRNTPLPIETPVALTSAFAENADKQRQWKAFLTRNNLTNAASLEMVVKTVHTFLWPVVTALIETGSFTGGWRSGGWVN